MKTFSLAALALATALTAAALTGAPALAQTAAPVTGAPSPAARPSPAPAPAATPAADLIDINSASPDQLATLSGIGPARADAIVKGRPYKGKDELLRKKVIPESVYNGIRDKIVARQKG